MKTVVVTGGSRGIGKAVVESLAKKGYAVLLNYHTSEKEAKEIQKKLKEEGYFVEIYKADVSQKEEVKEMMEFARNKMGSIDILINNAGISQIKTFADLTEEDWDQMMQINLKSMYLTTKEILSDMLQKQEGIIINISSIWGVIGASCEVHYATAKAGVIGFTKALAKELGPSHIRVNAIAPGIIQTDMNANIGKEDTERIKQEIPLECIGKPEDIAKCVEWLVEDQYTTGQVISVDGGWGIA